MSDSETPDRDLLEQWVKHRREPAFQELVKRYHGLVHAVALRSCGDPAMADEVTQLTFITLVGKAPSLASRASLGGWLHLTAVMQTRNLIRKRQREEAKRRQFMNHVEPAETETPEAAWQRLQPLLDSAMAILPDRDREALIMRYYRSQSIREIAAALGIAAPAAEKRLKRAVLKMRGELISRGCAISAATLPAALQAGLAADAGIAPAVFSFTAITTSPVAAAMSKAGIAVIAVILLLAGGVYTVIRSPGEDGNLSQPTALAAVQPSLPRVPRRPAAPAPPTVIAATVNGWLITKGVFDYTAEPLLDQLEKESPQQDSDYLSKREAIRDEVLDGLIDQEILIGEYGRVSGRGAKVPDAAVDAEIYRQVVERFGGDEVKLGEALKRAGLADIQFRAIIRDGLIAKAIRAEYFPVGSYDKWIIEKRKTAVIRKKL